MAYHSMGDLFSFVEDRRRLPEAQAKPIIQGMLSALSHIHQAGIIHRDLKPENILMTHDCRPVVADFGIAVHVDDAKGSKSRPGSPGYMAPELINGLPYGTNSDIFGAGATFFFMLTGSLAFNAHTAEQMVNKNRCCNVNFRTSSFRALSEKTQVFLRRFLEADPMLRPEAAKALEWLGRDESQPQMKELHQCAQETSSQWVTNAAKDTHIRLAEASPVPQSQDSANTALRQFPLKAPALPKTQTAPHRQRLLKRPSDPEAKAQEVPASPECVSPVATGSPKVHACCELVGGRSSGHPGSIGVHNRSGDPRTGQSSSSENCVSSRMPEQHLSIRPDSSDVHDSQSSKTYQPVRPESDKQTSPVHQRSLVDTHKPENILQNFRDELQDISDQFVSASFSEDSLSSPTELGTCKGRLKHFASVSSSASTAMLSEPSGERSSDVLMCGQARSCGELESIRVPASGSLILSLQAKSCGALPDISESLEEEDDE